MVFLKGNILEFFLGRHLNTCHDVEIYNIFELINRSCFQWLIERETTILGSLLIPSKPIIIFFALCGFEKSISLLKHHYEAHITPCFQSQILV